MQEHTTNTVRHRCCVLLATSNLTTSVFYGWLCGAKLFHTMHLTSSNCTESGKRAKPLQRMWILTTFRSVQRHPDNWLLCIYSIQSTTVHEFTKVLVHKQPSLLQNLPERYLQHFLRFLAPALMFFPLALATTSRVWSGRSYIYKIADWRSDNTLQASIPSVAQKQS
jgi:hypothetical protein